jgi:hypothetical protein
MKRLRLVKDNSSCEDRHFVWEESTAVYVSQTKQSLTKTEAKKITRNEALKPLFIIREE